MAAPLLERMGFPETGKMLGNGTLTGAAVGGGLALLGALGGLTEGLGLLGWLLVPLGALVGGLAGDAINKDGPLFGHHGALSHRGQPAAVVPPGYLSPALDSMTYAVSSRQVVTDGGVYSGTGFHDFLDMRGDPRLQELEKLASKYGQENPPPPPGASLEDVRKWEKTIIDKIVRDIGDTYGEYSAASYIKGLHPEEIRGMHAGDNPRLSAMKKGTLVCRHYAPILSHLADKAGIANHVVSCHTCCVRPQEGNPRQLEFVESLVATAGFHLTVITDRGRAFAEATTAGDDDWKKRAYKPVINDVDVHGVIAGRAALVPFKEKGRAWVYGGHDGKGSKHPEVAMRESVRGYNAGVMKRAQEEFDKIMPSLQLGLAGLGMPGMMPGLVSLTGSTLLAPPTTPTPATNPPATNPLTAPPVPPSSPGR